LGEFSPIYWAIVYFGHFFKITELAHILGQLFPHGKSYVLFWQKISLATFWAIFSQTHLVTLALVSVLRESPNFYFTKVGWKLEFRALNYFETFD
jgi:hypothetical protein